MVAFEENNQYHGKQYDVFPERFPIGQYPCVSETPAISHWVFNGEYQCERSEYSHKQQKHPKLPIWF